MLPFVDNLMPFRYQHLQWTLKGLEMTGVPLIEYDGTKFLPAGISDDTGIYFFIPQIAKLLNVSLDWAIFIFFSIPFILSILTSIFIISKLCKTNLNKFFGYFNILVISIYLYYRGDIYIFSGLIPFFVILILYYFHIRKINNLILYSLFFLIGIIFSFSNFIRNHSGTSLIIFLIIFFLLEYKNYKKKVFKIILFFLIGSFISTSYINSIKKNKDDFLLSKNIHNAFIDGHVFWHTIFLGLGFLNNKYDIKYNDDIAYTIVKQKNKDIIIHSNDYENILKNEVINIVKEDPWFILKTIFAKFGVVLIYILVFTNFGFFFIIKKIKKFKIFIPLFAGLLFNLIFPIIVMPYPSYLTGFISFLLLINIFSTFELETLNNIN